MNPVIARADSPWRPFSDRGGSAAPLKWIQPRAKGYWELLSGDRRIATLVRQGLLRHRWLITGPSSSWTFERDWRGRRWLKRPGEREAAVQYEPAWRGGRLRLCDATRLLWKRLSMRRTHWAVTNEDERPLVVFHAVRGPFRVEGSIEFDASARRLNELEPLLLLGWILVLDARRSHAH